eukprot:TRINITY_DN7663_c0_g1_i1.p2 TRINITY_DN7663_c0_g1~~TRINITY_DN7663_c0_g1_i1.p2  ORF type:complete len:164 (-),score=40.85 TRINITY_DN7663_c0_g1_i1:103-594(-)
MKVLQRWELKTGKNGVDVERTRKREAYFRQFTSDAKKLIANSEFKPAVMLTGGLRTLQVMESILQNEDADLLGLARPLAVEPTLPHDLLAGKVTGVANYVAPLPFLFTKSKLLFGLGETVWFRAQNKLLADGQEPDLNMTMFRALMGEIMLDVYPALKKKLFG